MIHPCSRLLLLAVLPLCMCVHCAPMCETTKVLNVGTHEAPALHCRITPCADGMLPSMATVTVSKAESLQPVSWSCDSSPSLDRGCPLCHQGLLPGEGHWLLLSQGLTVQQAPAPRPH